MLDKLSTEGIDKAIGEVFTNFASPILKEMGEGLADIIRIARIPAREFLDKRKAKFDIALNKLRKEMIDIGDENIFWKKMS